MIRSLSNIPRATIARCQLLTSARSIVTIPKTRQIIFDKFQNRLNQFQPLATSHRSFNTSQPKLTTAANPPRQHSVNPPAPSAKQDNVPQSFSEIVERHGGWVPFIGLGAFTLIAKEIYILDAEFLLATNFLAVVGIFWLMAGESLTGMVEAYNAKRKKHWYDVFQFRIAGVEKEIRDWKRRIAEAELLTEIKNEYNTVVSQVVHAKDMKARKVAYDNVISRLQQIKSKRDAEQTQYLTTVYDLTSDYVREQFAKLPQQQKNAMIEHAIALIGKQTQGVLNASNDPVKKLYQDYLGGKLYEKDMAAGKKPSTQ